MKKFLQIIFLVTFIMCCSAGMAMAVPALQLYADGAFYDHTAETWVVSHMEDFNLQVIGAQEIYDVSLAIAVRPWETGTITIDSVATGPYTFGTPVLGSGKSLPPHDIYPTYFTTYPIGDFGLVETVYDMIPGGGGGSATGEIKTFSISLSGYTWAHFDAFDHIVLNEKHVKYTFAPFSHDLRASPEPATLSLMGLGLLGFGIFRRKKKV